MHSGTFQSFDWMSKDIQVWNENINDFDVAQNGKEFDIFDLKHLNVR